MAAGGGVRTVGLAVAGLGAFGSKHLEVLARLPAARIVALVDPDLDKARAHALAHPGARPLAALDAALASADVDAVVLATPTPQHAAQALRCLAAGKHVLVEIPLADDLAGAEAVVRAQAASGRVAMCGHTRRYNPGHGALHRRIGHGDFRLLHLDVQTFFLRRTNINLRGEPRGWTDHLLWHHAAHSVDLFQWQTGEPVTVAQAIQGPVDPALGIALDLSIQLRSAGGALCTVALSFNDAGPQGSVFRYIGDTGTYLARYDALTDAAGTPVDPADGDPVTDGVERQDRDFLAAILAGRAPEASVARVLPCYRTLDALDRALQRAG